MLKLTRYGVVEINSKVVMTEVIPIGPRDGLVKDYIKTMQFDYSITPVFMWNFKGYYEHSEELLSTMLEDGRA